MYKEGRYVVVIDIPGAFLHADMNETVHMLLEGTTTELIVKLEPKVFRNCKRQSKEGKHMLYVQLRKALYGTVQTPLFFWKLLYYTLVE